MNNIKVSFSIKDLENLTGIKAHTIRIWEKRYNLLSPNRSDTNIRNYSLTSFQKLLNISYLNNNGLKISKIAELDEEQIPTGEIKPVVETAFDFRQGKMLFQVILQGLAKLACGKDASFINTLSSRNKKFSRWANS